LYYQLLHLTYLCNVTRYWLRAPWGWHSSVETCRRSVIICEIIVHLLVHCTKYKIKKMSVICSAVSVSILTLLDNWNTRSSLNTSLGRKLSQIEIYPTISIESVVRWNYCYLVQVINRIWKFCHISCRHFLQIFQALDWRMERWHFLSTWRSRVPIWWKLFQ
jgi:hypothetical protein